ncbi:hypothetical protein AX774_g2144 [Zancudomyces culisetae]|uniref:Uncharacterized protein n=1 Tax=Zancudomyces culisetae TaxID=1213189 RepID=A0A1R1PTS1_ZANCU|nr:hypothetical protein AX774_g2144 [Zancudomyces culisetae]|eukprot:OMH84344.1 hypothetical protein AX774_g2144 [Zancudomyces culisetae]
MGEKVKVVFTLSVFFLFETLQQLLQSDVTIPIQSTLFPTKRTGALTCGTSLMVKFVMWLYMCNSILRFFGNLDRVCYLNYNILVHHGVACHILI